MVRNDSEMQQKRWIKTPPQHTSQAKKLMIHVAQEFLARAKIMKDNGMEETNIVKQLNEELKKYHGDGNR